MNEEKWFTADEAVEFGFANFVKRAEPQDESQDISSMIQDAVAIAMAEFKTSLDEKPLPTGSNILSEQKTKSLIARLRKGE